MSTNKGKQRSDIVLEVLGQPIPNNVSLDETMSPILQLYTNPRPPATQTKGSANCTGQIYWSFSSPCSVSPGSLKEGKLIDTVATSPTYPLWNQQLMVFLFVYAIVKTCWKFYRPLTGRNINSDEDRIWICSHNSFRLETSRSSVKMVCSLHHVFCRILSYLSWFLPFS